MPWTTPPGAGATVFIWNGYSLAERDRRWNAVRANASEAGFDCILVPLGNGIDARYMTQLRCSALVLPSDGRAPIVIADRRSNNEWVAEPWQTGREWAEPMAEALLDLGMVRARIGVAGLKGGVMTHCESVEGVVNHTALEHVIGKLPNARLEDATDVIGKVRHVKSTEEIEFIRRSAEVANAGLDELIKVARPGADAGVVYSAVLARMLEERSEYFPMTLTIDSINAGKPKHYTNPPIGRRLEANSLITDKIHAIMGAQLTQVCQPILLGKVSSEWQSVIDLQREVYEAGLALIKPGATFAQLADFANGFGVRRGMKTIMQLHGCGYGDDGPLFNRRFSGARARDLQIASGNAFIWKPIAMTADERIKFAWGGPVLVGAHGAEALFKRAHGMVSVV
jgi:Xaa-Pro aminopeptidase